MRVVFLILCFIFTSPALGAEDIFTAPGGGYHMITQDDSTTTAQCLGDASTPYCAFETLLGCIVRQDKKLCHTIGMKPSADSKFSQGIYYKVTGIDRLVWVQDAYSLEKAGDIQVYANAVFCLSEEECPSHKDYDESASVTLRKKGTQWFVIAYNASYYPQVYPVHTRKIPLPQKAPHTPFPMPDGKWHFITQDKKKNNPICSLGDESTPVCALETMLACGRNAADICLNPYLLEVPLFNVLYRIDKLETSLWIHPDITRSIQVNDLSLYAHTIECSIDEYCSKEKAEESYYEFRQQDSKWINLGYCIGDCD